MKKYEHPTPETIVKKLTIELLRRDNITIVDDFASAMTDNITHNSTNKSLAVHQRECAKEIGFDAIVTQTNIEERMRATNKLLASWLVKIESLGLANSRDESTGLCKAIEDGGDGRARVKAYSITPQGLETALKLQEHDDNRDRFKQQKIISKTLQTNSTRSVYISVSALCISILLVGLSAFRTYQLEEKIMSHDTMKQRIHSAEEESSRLDEEVVRLKDELNRLISVDNDKGKPVAVIVDSNKPATEP
jgi:hypothetical protein